ncbi:MAG: thioredoxin family protein [Pseudomonadota bacterium]
MATLGETAPDFELPATDGRTIALSDVMLEHGAVIAFICNHCPYVTSSARRMAQDADALAAEGIGFAAICSNDAQKYPADSFERMGAFAADMGFRFPYLHDETQTIATAYGAEVTPHFFGLNGRGRIHYIGRMDGGTTSAPPEGSPRELVEAMRVIAKTGQGPRVQNPPRGCTIKWR